TKRTRPMMILATNIIGDRPTHRNKFCPWRDRKKPATWNNQLQNLRQGNPRFTGQQTLLLIKGKKTSQMAYIERNTPLIQATITIAPSIPIGQDRSFQGGKIWNLIAPEYWNYLTRRYLGITAPGGWHFCVSCRLRSLRCSSNFLSL